VLAFEQALSAPAAVTADGELRWGETPQTDLRLQWTDLVWPGVDWVSSPAGELALTGWLDAFEFDGSGALIADGIESDAVASGSGTADALTFDSLSLSGMYGELIGSGRLDLDPLVWALGVVASDLDPGFRFEEWPGALTGRGMLSGRADPALELRLDDFALAGRLRDQSVEVSGSVGYEAPNRWVLNGVQVDARGGRIDADGTIDESLALEISVDTTDLESLVPGATGAVTLQARLAGTLDLPQINGTVRASDLRVGDYAAGTLSLSADLLANPDGTVSAILQAEDVSWRDIEAHTVTGSITGTAASHTAVLELAAQSGAASLRAAGEWTDQRWVGEVSALDVDEPVLGAWRLTAPAALALGRGELALERACLSRDAASLCAASRLGTDDDLTEIQLSTFDIAAFNAVLPEDTTLAGIYDASARVTGPWSRPAVNFMASGANTVITIREADAPPLELPIQTLEVQATLSDEGILHAEGALEGAGGARVGIDADVEAFWSAEPRLAAQLSGAWSDLGILSLLSPDVGEVSGAASIDLEIGGNLHAPDIRGQARWSGGRIEVPRWGFVLEDVQADLSSADGTVLVLDASARAGEGDIAVNGTVDVDPEAGWPTELRIFGRGLQAVRLPEADIVISPSLLVRARLPDIEVEGAFLVPRARVTLDELPPQAARPSPDTIVHGIEATVDRRPLNVRANIRVGLGSDVRYSGAGLDVALSGAMGLVYESGRNAVASGAVNLSGVYRAYGQTLEIDRGQLLFTGPLENPTLDVRAIRRIDPSIVGVQLTGTVEAPVSRVFSEPAMNEADALAYLVLGRPLATTGEQESASLEAAALSMGLQQALPAIQRVGESLGLDELALQATTADAGELMAGKQLSPRIYIRYTYGLFNRIGGVLLRLDVTDRVSLETRSGDYRSMDLIYTLERD
jgi:translocation and assembly module TamB